MKKYTHSLNDDHNTLFEIIDAFRKIDGFEKITIFVRDYGIIDVIPPENFLDDVSGIVKSKLIEAKINKLKVNWVYFCNEEGKLEININREDEKNG
jgi:hypothetical protein